MYGLRYLSVVTYGTGGLFYFIIAVLPVAVVVRHTTVLCELLRNGDL